MREFTFRAKRKSTGEWLYGFLLSDSGRHYILEHDQLKHGINAWDYLDVHLPEVTPETIGQDTGLRIMDEQPDGDTEVTFVYEGDIVEEVRTRWHSIVNREPDRYLICWEGTSFCYQNHYASIPFDDCEAGLDISHCKVIGNIHDNPELFVKEKENAED